MTNRQLYEAIGDIRETYIQEAKQTGMEKDTQTTDRKGNTEKNRKTADTKISIRLKWETVAACLILLAAVGTWNWWKPSSKTVTFIGGIERNYKNTTISSAEASIVWPWEYMTICEKYTYMEFENRAYRTRARVIEETLLGDVLGNCLAQGYDIYSDQTYTESFGVRRINGISEDHLVAVGLENEYYVFLYDSSEKPATLGELIDIYNLTQTLAFNRFTDYQGYTAKGCYELQDDTYMWQILSQCRDAELIEDADMWAWGDRNYVSFTATSQALGVYKNVFYVSEDGYIFTNIFNYGYDYYIGEGAANEIIDYVKNNSTETDFEPYEYSLAGTITEISEEYILVDDSVLCVNQNEGMIFKIPTEDVRIQRYVEHADLQAGDLVLVKFQGTINTNAENEVEGAYSISEGILIDGSVAVPE